MNQRTHLESGVLLTVLFAAPLFGQGDQDAFIQKLLDRVNALEREVAALQQSREPAQPAAPAVPQPAVVSSNTDSPAPQTADEASRFAFHGYADTEFSRNADANSTKKFALGEIDLFATSAFRLIFRR